MVNTLYLPELREMLAEHDANGLHEFCTAIHPAQTAEFMEGLDAEETWAVLQYAETPLREEIFSYLVTPKQIKILQSLDQRQAALLLGRLAPDDRVDLLQELDRPCAMRLVHELTPTERREVLQLIGYPADTAAATDAPETTTTSLPQSPPRATKKLVPPRHAASRTRRRRSSVILPGEAPALAPAGPKPHVQSSLQVAEETG